MSKPQIILVLSLALFPSAVTLACSCRPGTTLQQHYDWADNVLIATITGCAPDRLSYENTCLGHGWSFETLEDLKGSDASIRVPTNTGGTVNTCDIAPKVGGTYLLFLKNGRASRCDGTRRLEDAQNSDEVRILRAYRDGVTTRIESPWQFTDNGSTCMIFHQLEGVDLRFNHQYAIPPNAVVRGTGGSSLPVTNMMISLAQPFEFVGPTLLEANGEAVPLIRSTVPLPNGRTFSVDGIRGDAVSALLDTMSNPVEVVVSGERASPFGAAEAYRVTTQTTGMRAATDKFRDCMARHPAPSDQR